MQIDLDAQLYRWRQLVAESGHTSAGKAVAMRATSGLLARPWLFRAAGAAARASLRLLPRGLVRAAAGAWGRAREVPEPPAGSFRAWYRANRRDGRPAS